VGASKDGEKDLCTSGTGRRIRIGVQARRKARDERQSPQPADSN
jgi:hypothetical protein